jgi:hypothetical protein
MTGIIKTSFVFNEGNIPNYKVSGLDPEVHSTVKEVDEILRPVIQHYKLSGKIVINILNSRMHIGYENIKPVKYTSILMQLIKASSESRDPLFL